MITALWRAAARLACATVLIGLLAAIPAGLIHFIGWPLPDHVPSGEELYRFATAGMSDQTVLDAIAILLWPVWAVFTVSVAVEAIASVRGVQAPRLVALSPVQGLAAILVAGITAGVFATTTIGPLASALGPAPAAAAPATHVQEPHRILAAPTVAVNAAATAKDAALAHTAGTVTLNIGDCGYTYHVVKNDSLWRIANECLGDPQRWPEIWKLNQGKYWPHISGATTLRDPDLIFPGWELTLPADAVVPAGAEPVTPATATPPPQPSPSPSITANPATTPSPTQSALPSPAPSPAGPGSNVDSDGVYAPPTTAPPPTGSPSGSRSAATGSAAPAVQAAPGDQQTPSQAGPQAGIDLPGGWIPLGLGAGLLAAVAMAWRRRRHRYKPTPITTPRLDDPDLVPPLAAMTRIRQTLRRHAPDDLDTKPAAAPTVREYASAEVKPPLPPVGPTGADLAGARQLPLATGLGLTGPAALDAARGLLVAVLTSGSDDDPDAKGRAIVPASTLATLLGVSAVELGPIARLTITDTIADAITVLEEEIIRRFRLTADAQAPTAQAMRDNDIHAEPLPQLLLITELAEPAWNSRLGTAVRLGHSVDIGAALIGDWPSGTPLHIAEDGTTSGTDHSPRLAVLNTAITIEMLTLLREAHSDTETTLTPAPDAPQHHPAPPATTEQPAGASSDSADADPDTPPAPAAGGPPVTVRILGRPLILGHDGEPSMEGLRASALEMLVYLAINRNGATKSALMEMLYPHSTLRRATDSLSTTVANLRKTIRQAANTEGHPDTGKPAIESVVNTGGHYHLNPQVVSVDWWTVTDQYAQVAHATGDEQRLAHLTAALGASNGPLAQDATYDWIDTDREAVRRCQIKLHAHAASLHAHDDPHQAWLLLEQACDLDPLNEELTIAAMRSAAATDDADSIRHRFKMLRDALDDAGIDIHTDTETTAKELLSNLR